MDFFCYNYKVATLSIFYSTVSYIIPNLKSEDNSNMTKLINKNKIVEL